MSRLIIAPADAVSDARLTDADFRVLSAICIHTNGISGVGCFKSATKLAEIARVSRRTFFDATKRLIQFGYLKRERRLRGNGSYTSSMYDAIIDPAERDAARTAEAEPSDRKDNVEPGSAASRTRGGAGATALGSATAAALGSAVRPHIQIVPSNAPRDRPLTTTTTPHATGDTDTAIEVPEKLLVRFSVDEDKALIRKFIESVPPDSEIANGVAAEALISLMDGTDVTVTGKIEARVIVQAVRQLMQKKQRSYTVLMIPEFVGRLIRDAKRNAPSPSSRFWKPASKYRPTEKNMKEIFKNCELDIPLDDDEVAETAVVDA